LPALLCNNVPSLADVSFGMRRRLSKVKGINSELGLSILYGANVCMRNDYVGPNDNDKQKEKIAAPL